MRLTTREEHPHGAEGRAEEKLTGKWCRGTFEATAIVERLAAYENLEEDGLLYVIGDVIHPKIISRVLGVELETAVRILDDLSKKGYLRQELQYYCPCCDDLVGPVYDTINNLPESYCCPICGNIMSNSLEDVIVSYRKVQKKR